MQRTKEWFEKRRGRFTGSEIKKLMSCSKSTSKIEWGRSEKLIDLGETAKKYIYKKAMERIREKVIKTPSTAAMNYGTENEDVVKRMIKIQLGWDVQEVGFTEFIIGIAGASPDGYLPTPKMGCEIKCATNWDWVYDRMAVPVDQSHVDFWQLQTEMLALNVKQILYVVAEPSEDIFKPNITNIQTKVVDLSPIHAKAIHDRCQLGNQIIEKFISGVEFHEAIQIVCTNFKAA